MSYRTGISPLHEAIEKHDLIALEALLDDESVDLNITTVDGDTALHTAALVGNLEAIKLLVAHGADVNRPVDFSGTTPLHFAASRTNAQIVRELIMAGADVNTQNKLGQTPIYFVEHSKNDRVIESLLRAGARLDIVDQFGQTATEGMSAQCRQMIHDIEEKIELEKKRTKNDTQNEAFGMGL